MNNLNKICLNLKKFTDSRKIDRSSYSFSANIASYHCSLTEGYCVGVECRKTYLSKSHEDGLNLEIIKRCPGQKTD